MSSRSIASARQKRAGEPVSIATRGPGQYSMPQKSGTQDTRQLVPVNKISISDAIGLITIRLGRAEQFLQSLQENSNFFNDESVEKMPPLDKTMLNNIMTRLDSIEKKDVDSKTQKIDQDVLNKIDGLEKSCVKVSKLEQDIRDMKDLLMLNTLKYEKFVLESENKIKVFETRFLEKLQLLESQIQKEDPPLAEEKTETEVINEIHDVTVEIIESEEKTETITTETYVDTEPQEKTYGKKSKKFNVSF
jgi:hypothetical protein